MRKFTTKAGINEKFENNFKQMLSKLTKSLTYIQNTKWTQLCFISEQLRPVIFEISRQNNEYK